MCGPTKFCACFEMRVLKTNRDAHSAKLQQIMAAENKIKNRRKKEKFPEKQTYARLMRGAGALSACRVLILANTYKIAVLCAYEYLNASEYLNDASSLSENILAKF